MAPAAEARKFSVWRRPPSRCSWTPPPVSRCCPRRSDAWLAAQQRRVGRSGAAAPARTTRRAGPRSQPGGRRRRRRSAARRDHLPRLRSARRAGGDRRSGQGSGAHRPDGRHLHDRSFRGAVGRGCNRARAVHVRVSIASAGWIWRPGSAAVRRRGGGAGLPPGGQSRGGDAAAVRRGGGDLPVRGRAPGAGRHRRPGSDRPRAARGVVGAGRLGRCLRRADLGRPAGAAPLGALAGTVSDRRLPGRPLAGSARRAGDLRRGGRAGGLVGRRRRGRPTAVRADRPASPRDRRAGARRRHRRRSGATGAAPADLQRVVRRRGDPDPRAGPGRLRRGQRLGLQRQLGDAVARPRRDGCPHPRQRTDRADPDHHARPRSTPSSTHSHRSWPPSGLG